MTTHLPTTHTETAALIARDKLNHHPGTSYSHAMVEAEEFVRALEILGLIKCMPIERPIGSAISDKS